MKTIAVIEDNDDVRENLVEILTLSGYEVIEAENGKIGVKKVLEHKPDLILCDVMMPELDGFGVLKVLNHNPDMMHIPFMFLTAKAEKTDFRKGMGLGADDYITKPFDDVELLEALEMRLAKSEKLQVIDQEGQRTFFDDAKGEEEFKKLIEDREVRRYNKRDIIYASEQYPNWLYYVVSGQVKCYHTNELGKELITHVYGDGDIFGYTPLLTNKKYQSSAMAVEISEIQLISPEDFKSILFNNRDFAAKFISILANYADHTEGQLIDLAYSSVRRKVANALIMIDQSSKHNTFKIMREDLAALAGTAKETVIRTLSDFKSEGIIDLLDGAIKINNMQALIDMPQ